MIIGTRFNVVSKSDNEVKIKVFLAGGGNTVVKIPKGSTIKYLSDPAFGENNSAASIETVSFDEMLDFIEDYDGEYEFTDDMGYIHGISFT